MLFILITVDRIRGDIGKLAVFIRFLMTGGCRTGYLSHNITDNLYLSLAVGCIPDAIAQAVEIVDNCRQIVSAVCLAVLAAAKSLSALVFASLATLMALLIACKFSTESDILPSFPQCLRY